jgi:hypothetical protein
VPAGLTPPPPGPLGLGTAFGETVVGLTPLGGTDSTVPVGVDSLGVGDVGAVGEVLGPTVP